MLVARLNTGIRDQRLAAGELRSHGTVGGTDYAAGDRLVPDAARETSAG
jgi:hypothetical protein